MFQCPFCGRWKLFVHTVTKRWICFRCDRGGTLAGDTHRLQRSYNPDKPPPKEFEMPPFRELGSAAYAYLVKRGIKPETMEEFALVQGVTGVWAGQRTDMWSSRIIFPVTDHGENVYCTARTYLPRDKREKYWTPPGYAKKEHVLRTFDGTVAWAVLVEGPLDALKLYQAGWPAVALLGKNLSSEKREKILTRVTEGVIIALDADAWGACIRICESLGPYLETRLHLQNQGDFGEKSEEEISKELGG